MINNWYDIYTEQLSKIVDSGLLNKCSKLLIHFLGTSENLELAKKLITPFKNIEFCHDEQISLFEFPSLKKMWNLANSEGEFYAWYIHTKGVSQINNEKYYGYEKNYDNLYSSVNDWRIYMEYFNILNHNDCIEILDNKFDCCGCNWSNTPHKHFSGNFWWASSTYIKTLPNLDSLDLNNRHLAENWIGMSNPRKYNFYTNQAGYVNRINPNSYSDNNKFDPQNINSNNIYVVDSGTRRAGFFSYFMQIMYNVSKIDMANQPFYINLTHHMLYYDNKIPNPNVWEYYFSQPLSANNIKDTYNLIDVGLFVDDGYKQRFLHEDNIMMHNTYRKYFSVSSIIKDKVNMFYNNHMKNKKVLGIHVRGTDHYTDGLLLDSNYYMSKVDEELALNNYDKILLCTDEAKKVEDFKNAYGDKLIYHNDSIRTNEKSGIHYGVGLQNPYKMGEDVIIESLLLSKCNFLLRGVSNVTNAAMIFNPYIDNRIVDLHIKYEG